MRRFGQAAILVGAVALAVAGAMDVQGEGAGGSSRECPYLLKIGSEHSVELANLLFTEEVRGMRYVANLSEEDRPEYRYALATLKITKPAGQELSLAAADLTLHYYHGDEIEVCACDGISWFKTSPDDDAPPRMNEYPGPGFIKQTTGTRCTEDSVVYIDAVFRYMEADTKECWICVAQPVTRVPSYVCSDPAWKSD